MVATPRIIEQRLEQVEACLGISGLAASGGISHHKLPVNAVFVSASSDNPPVAYGTWELLDSGNVLGGQVGTVYVWKRTA